MMEITLLLCLLPSIVYTQYHQIKEEGNINKKRIIGKISIGSITYCLMKCKENPECHVIGTHMNSTSPELNHCYLLKTKECDDVDTTDDTVTLFIISDVDKKDDVVCDSKKKKEVLKEWKRIEIVDRATFIKKDTLLKTLDKVTKEYRVSLDIKPTGFTLGTWPAVIHCTHGKGRETYGGRTPCIFFHKNERGRLYIAAAVNGEVPSGYRVLSRESYPKDEWIHVELTQIHEAAGYNYTITINGKQDHTVINKQAETFYDVKCYLNSPYPEFPAQRGYIKNFIFYVRGN